MKTTTNKVRNIKTGQVFDVIPGSLLPDFFEEVRDDDIKVGEPKVEFEIESEPMEAEIVEVKEEKPKKAAKSKKSTKKGKKNA